MTLVRRLLIAVSDLPAFAACGWRFVYSIPGGWRLDGEAAIVEWRGGEPVYP